MSPQKTGTERLGLPPQASHGHWFLRNLPAFRADALRCMLEWAALGPLVRVRLGPVTQYVVTDADYIAHILQGNQRNYVKPARFLKIVRAVAGPAHDNLFTSEGDKWLALRRTMQPAFHRRRLEHFGALMAAEAAKTLGEWRAAAAAGRPVRLEYEMKKLTMEIIGRIMLSSDIGPEFDRLKAAFHTSAVIIMDRFNSVLMPPDWLPTAENRKLRQAVADVTAALDKIIEMHLAQGPGSNDLLDMLMAATDPETGLPLTRDQLISEMGGIVFAGHETTATALTWALYLVNVHEEVRAKLEAELEGVLGGRLPETDDLERLVYTRQVLQETLRCYPPAWTVTRQAVNEDELGGYRIPAGARLLINIYGLHHDPTLWPEPFRFDPERFAPHAATPRARHAFIPFAAGSRKCIGDNLAMMEGTLLLAAFAQAVRLRVRPGQVIEPVAKFTMQTRHDILVDVVPRTVAVYA